MVRPAVCDGTSAPDQQIQNGPAHDGGIDIDAGPVLDADDALIDEHSEAVEHGGAGRSGISDQRGGRWMGTGVGEDHSGPQSPAADGEPRAAIRIKAERGAGDPEVRARRKPKGAPPRDQGRARGSPLAEKLDEL